MLETSRLKRKLNQTEDLLYNEKEINNPKKKQKISKYEFYKFNKTKYSYSDEKINQLISSITSIETIIKLKNDWQGIRHNKELQKLFNIIPALEKLNNLIGMDKLKKDVFRKIIYFIKNKHNDEYLNILINIIEFNLLNFMAEVLNLIYQK